MEQYVLYLILKELAKELDNNFKYSFNDMDSNADNVCGIYIKGAEPSQYRTLKEGVYCNTVNRVQFLIQGGLDNNSLMSSLSLGSKLKDALIRASNRYIIAPPEVGYDEEGNIVKAKTGEILNRITVVLTKVDMLSDLVNIGKSEQGRPRYSINFKIYYELGGK